jgi:hypothetical protein
MAVPTVPGAGDVRELAQLARGKDAVRNRDPQHRRVLLDIQAVAQPQRAEFFLREPACEEALRLVAKLRYALVHNSLVDFVVPVHVPAIVAAALMPTKTNVLRCYAELLLA